MKRAVAFAGRRQPRKADISPVLKSFALPLFPAPPRPQERLRAEQRAERRLREDAQRRTAAARSVHPYDAAYTPALKAQLAAQQQFYYGPPAEAAARQYQRQQQYATFSGAAGAGGGTPDRRQAAVAVQRKGAPLPPALDPRSFAPLGAGAVGLQQGLQRQRSAGANAAAAVAAGYDPRYRTIG